MIYYVRIFSVAACIFACTISEGAFAQSEIMRERGEAGRERAMRYESPERHNVGTATNEYQANSNMISRLRDLEGRNCATIANLAGQVADFRRRLGLSVTVFEPCLPTPPYSSASAVLDQMNEIVALRNRIMSQNDLILRLKQRRDDLKKQIEGAAP